MVESNGTLVRHGTGVSESKEIGTPGEYEVVFNQNVSQCAYTATLGSTSDGSAPAGEIGVASRAEGLFKAKIDAVYIQTYNSTGTTTAEPFHSPSSANQCQIAGRHAAVTAGAPSNTSSPPTASTRTASPSRSFPSNSARASRSVSCFWITRRSGRAP